MKDSDFLRRIDLAYVGGGFIPVNDNAHDLMSTAVKGQVFNFKEITARDLKFHNAYFSLINYIYRYMPQQFREKVSYANFYTFLKHIKGDFDVIYEFNDGTKYVEYKSISFGKMSQEQFINYVRDQLPFIYENLIRRLFSDEISDSIIGTIEEEYAKFLEKL